MKHVKNSGFVVLGALFIFILANWGAETSQAGRPKPAINFEGILTTEQEEALRVENITFNGKYKQIPMYDAPSGAKALEKEKSAILNEKTGHKEVILRKHPKNNFVLTKVDLSEVSKINVMSDPLYVFEDKEKKRRTVFLKITLVLHDQKKTPKSYLVEDGHKLFCDEKNEAGPLEKEVPLSAIKELVISGFHEQEVEVRVKSSEESEESFDDKNAEKKQEKRKKNGVRSKKKEESASLEKTLESDELKVSDMSKKEQKETPAAQVPSAPVIIPTAAAVPVVSTDKKSVPSSNPVQGAASTHAPLQQPVPVLPKSPDAAKSSVKIPASVNVLPTAK